MGYRIVITGASSDIGIQLIKMLDEDASYHGSILFCQYNTNPITLNNLKTNLFNVDIVMKQVDLSSEVDIMSWIEEIRTYGTPTHIVHLAAEKFEYMRHKDLDVSKINRSLEIQLLSIMRITKELLPQMAKEKYGRIVFMLTAYTLGTPPKFMSHYITVKYALEGFMKGLACEYAGKGVTVNAVSPNLMDTKFLSEVDKRTAEITAKSTLMKRNVEIRETCAGIQFLMSDNSSYINGINLNITGGDYM